ncbi:MAG: GNAT family N-acetyltransferase [Chitinophagales bacterium]|nr:GNAT family N-acetyltransferase [Chitinophagales bacterium]MCO5247779.1 GNAT family N-acetyltransferase [Chitinophagales bacterium]
MQKAVIIEFDKNNNGFEERLFEIFKSKPFETKTISWTSCNVDTLPYKPRAYLDSDVILTAILGEVWVDIELVDNTKQKFNLSQSNIGVFIPKLSWFSIYSEELGAVISLSSKVKASYIDNYIFFKNIQGRKISFVEYTEQILEQSWDWLHDEEIKHLTNTPNFTRQDQRKWFDSLSSNSTYFVRGIMLNDETIGIVGLKHIDLEEKKAEFFGYIGNKSYWGIGLGGEMLKWISFIAIDMFKLKQLYLNVILDNIRAIKAYEKFGFKIVEVNEVYIKMSIEL